MHCVECLSARFLYESVLGQLGSEVHCDNANDFVHNLQLTSDGQATFIVLDKAERLRDLNDGTMYLALLKLQEFSRLNVCVILVSEIPFEKFRHSTGSCEPITVFFPQYSKGEFPFQPFFVSHN